MVQKFFERGIMTVSYTHLEPTVYTVRVKVSETTTYRFRAEYLDGNGRRRTASAAEVEIAIGAGGERPEGEKPSEPLAAPMVQRTKSSDLYLWLLAGACAVLLALSVGCLLYTSPEGSTCSHTEHRS